jgi:hypothetical protein
MNLRTLLFRAEIVLWSICILVFLFFWVTFAGPQLHVAETFIGLGIATVAFSWLYIGSRKRFKEREELAAEAARLAEAAAMAARAEKARQQDERDRQFAEELEKRRRAEKACQQAENDRKYGEQRKKKRQAEEARGTGKESTADAEPESVPPAYQRLQKMIEELFADTSPEEQEKLIGWLRELLEIRKQPVSPLAKIKMLGYNLKKSKAVAPIAKRLLLLLKKHGWDDLARPAKLAVGAAFGALLLGGGGAGIAAFGGAIGVPLFVVFGAGGALAGVIIEEFERKRGNK